MPYFQYEAVTSSGKKTRGQIRAINKYAAISELREKGIQIRSVQESEASLLQKEIFIGRAVKLQDFVVFCRQFAVLIRSGVQIDEALNILEKQTQSKYLKRALGEVHDQVRTGQALSVSMEQHPKIFPEMFISMIASAEAAGNMDDVLDRMALHYEKEHKTVQKIKSAMTYPIIVMIVTNLVVAFLLMKIVPTFAAMFEDQGEELPWITKFVMGASDFVTDWWWIILLAIVGLVTVFQLLLKKEEIRYEVDKLSFKIPIFGSLLKKAAIARMSRNLSSLYLSAVPLLQSIDITQKVIGNKAFEKVLQGAKESLSEGKQLSDPFRESGMFPEMFLHMLYVGEETGQIDQMLVKIAEFYEDDVDNSVDKLKATIEPLLLLFVSCIVGVIVAAMLSPMFAMYENFLN
ncbi:type II secretion system F family protein [Marinicrinis sediminis]|uniref:Type II secretion system F family protein n=1 Tax=Marinicrinis sediminis TaxID=1652465 RepID=A0ABW5RCW2_9BACL